MTSQHEALTPVAAETERGCLCPACGGGLESEETERVANGGGGRNRGFSLPDSPTGRVQPNHLLKIKQFINKSPKRLPTYTWANVRSGNET